MKMTILPYKSAELRTEDLIDVRDRRIVLNYKIGIKILNDFFGGYFEIWEGDELLKDFVVDPRHHAPDLVEASVYNFLNRDNYA